MVMLHLPDVQAKPCGMSCTRWQSREEYLQQDCLQFLQCPLSITYEHFSVRDHEIQTTIVVVQDH